MPRAPTPDAPSGPWGRRGQRSAGTRQGCPVGSVGTQKEVGEVPQIQMPVHRGQREPGPPVLWSLSTVVLPHTY